MNLHHTLAFLSVNFAEIRVVTQFEIGSQFIPDPSRDVLTYSAEKCVTNLCRYGTFIKAQFVPILHSAYKDYTVRPENGLWEGRWKTGRGMMPKGPQGQKRPADAIGAAVMVARIATGEIKDNQKSGRVRSGKAGARARAAALTKEQRSEIARKAAEARWQ